MSTRLGPVREAPVAGGSCCHNGRDRCSARSGRSRPGGLSHRWQASGAYRRTVSTPTTFHSAGVLPPIELMRRAQVRGCRAIAATGHVGPGNVEDRSPAQSRHQPGGAHGQGEGHTPEGVGLQEGRSPANGHVAKVASAAAALVSGAIQPGNLLAHEIRLAVARGARLRYDKVHESLETNARDVFTELGFPTAPAA